MSTAYTPTTALLVIDVQHDFVHPDGNLSVPDAGAILEPLNEEIAAASAAGALVVYTQDWHPPSTPHFDTDGGTWPVHCVQGTWGAQLHDDLLVLDDAPVVRKGTDGGDGYSGFSVRDPASGETSATELDRILRDAGIRNVIVTGVALDVCVQATALDAVEYGYHTTVPLTLSRAVELADGDGAQAVERLRAAGVTVLPA